jgi:hypothetical protein
MSRRPAPGTTSDTPDGLETVLDSRERGYQIALTHLTTNLTRSRHNQGTIDQAAQLLSIYFGLRAGAEPQLSVRVTQAVRIKFAMTCTSPNRPFDGLPGQQQTWYADAEQNARAFWEAQGRQNGRTRVRPSRRRPQPTRDQRVAALTVPTPPPPAPSPSTGATPFDPRTSGRAFLASRQTASTV